MSKVAELLDRVKAATGQDREIDQAFVDLFGSVTKNGLPFCAGILGIGAFTLDMNTIVALIGEQLPGWSIDLSIDGKDSEAHLCDGKGLFLIADDTDVYGQGVTPALALCVAFLRAKIAQDDAAK